MVLYVTGLSRMIAAFTVISAVERFVNGCVQEKRHNIQYQTKIVGVSEIEIL